MNSALSNKYWNTDEHINLRIDAVLRNELKFMVDIYKVFNTEKESHRIDDKNTLTWLKDQKEHLFALIEYLDFIRTLLFTPAVDEQGITTESKLRQKWGERGMILPDTPLNLEHLYACTHLKKPGVSSKEEPSVEAFKLVSSNKESSLEVLFKELMSLPAKKQVFLSMPEFANYFHNMYLVIDSANVAITTTERAVIDKKTTQPALDKELKIKMEHITYQERLSSNLTLQSELQHIIASIYTPELFIVQIQKDKREDKEERDPDEDPQQEEPKLKRLRVETEGNDDDDAMFIDGAMFIGLPIKGYTTKGGKPNAEQKKLLEQYYHAEYIYHILTSLYHYLADHYNMIVLAEVVCQNRFYNNAKTRFEMVAQTLRDMKSYYYAHVYSALLPYYCINMDIFTTPIADFRTRIRQKSNEPQAENAPTAEEPASADTPADTKKRAQKLEVTITETVILEPAPEPSGRSILANMWASNDQKHEKEALRFEEFKSSDKNDLTHSVRTLSVFDHLWTNITDMRAPVDSKHNRLYMPYIFWSAFQPVEIKNRIMAKDGKLRTTASKLYRSDTIMFKISFEMATIAFRNVLFYPLPDEKELIYTTPNREEKQYETLGNYGSRLAVLNHHKREASNNVSIAWLRMFTILDKYITIHKNDDVHKPTHSYFKYSTTHSAMESVDKDGIKSIAPKTDLDIFEITSFLLSDPSPTDPATNPPKYSNVDLEDPIKKKKAQDMNKKLKTEYEKKVEEYKVAIDKFPIASIEASNYKGMTFLMRGRTGPAKKLIMGGQTFYHPLVMFEWLPMVSVHLKHLVLSHLNQSIWLPMANVTKDSAFLKNGNVNNQVTLVDTPMTLLPQTWRTNDESLKNVGNLHIDSPPIGYESKASQLVPYYQFQAAALKHIVIHLKPEVITAIWSNRDIMSPDKLRNTFAPYVLFLKTMPGKTDPNSIQVQFPTLFSAVLPDKSVSSITAVEADRLNMLMNGLKEIFLQTDTMNEEETGVKNAVLEVFPHYAFKDINAIISTKLPASLKGISIDDEVDVVSTYWWHAHHFNDTYEVVVPDYPMTNLEDLVNVNKDHYYIKNLKYLGPIIEKHFHDINYIKSALDLATNIKDGQSVTSIDKKMDDFGNLAKINITAEKLLPESIKKTEYMRDLNEFKLVRIGQSVLNWLTDNTSMFFTGGTDTEQPMKGLNYDPTVITDGLSLLSYGYTDTLVTTNYLTSSYNRHEFIKGSHLTPADKNTDTKTLAGKFILAIPSIFFTLRKTGQPTPFTTAANKYPGSWLKNVAALTQPTAWKLGPSNQVFKDIFNGLDSLQLMFSRRSAFVRRKYDEIVMRKKTFDYINTLIKRAEDEGVTTIVMNSDEQDRIVKMVKESSSTDKNDDINTVKTVIGLDDESKESTGHRVNVYDLRARFETAMSSFDAKYELTKTPVPVKIVDFTDLYRLELVNTELRYASEQCLDSTGKPVTVHRLFITDDTIKTMNAAKELPLMNIWSDAETEFVVQVPVETTFLLMALRSFRIPLSPEIIYSVYNTQLKYFNDTINEPNKIASSVPGVPLPSMGNAHKSTISYYDNDNMEQAMVVGNVKGCYSTLMNSMIKYDKMLRAHAIDADKLIFKHAKQRLLKQTVNALSTDGEPMTVKIYEALNSIVADELNPKNVHKYNDSDRDEEGNPIPGRNPNEKRLLEFIGDNCYNADKNMDSVWAPVSKDSVNDHTSMLILPELMNTLWAPRCGTDLLTNRENILAPMTLTNPVTEKEVTFTNQDILLRFYNHIYHQNKDITYTDNDEDSNTEIVRAFTTRNVPLLEDTWAFPNTEYTIGILDKDEEEEKEQTDDLKTFINALSDQDRRDRLAANRKFDNVADTYLHTALEQSGNMAYINFCIMSMAVLEQYVKNYASAPLLLKDYANWFTHEFTKPHITYQIPEDTFSPMMYREYRERETLLKSEELEDALEKNKDVSSSDTNNGTEEDITDKAADDALNELHKNRNESDTCFYLNRPLDGEMLNNNIQWDVRKTIEEMDDKTLPTIRAKIIKLRSDINNALDEADEADTLEKGAAEGKSKNLVAARSTTYQQLLSFAYNSFLQQYLKDDYPRGDYPTDSLESKTTSTLQFPLVDWQYSSLDQNTVTGTAMNVVFVGMPTDRIHNQLTRWSPTAIIKNKVNNLFWHQTSLFFPLPEQKEGEKRNPLQFIFHITSKLDVELAKITEENRKEYKDAVGEILPIETFIVEDVDVTNDDEDAMDVDTDDNKKPKPPKKKRIKKVVEEKEPEPVVSAHTLLNITLKRLAVPQEGNDDDDELIPDFDGEDDNNSPQLPDFDGADFDDEEQNVPVPENELMSDVDDEDVPDLNHEVRTKLFRQFVVPFLEHWQSKMMHHPRGPGWAPDTYNMLEKQLYNYHAEDDISSKDKPMEKEYWAAMLGLRRLIRSGVVAAYDTCLEKLAAYFANSALDLNFAYHLTSKELAKALPKLINHFSITYKDENNGVELQFRRVDAADDAPRLAFVDVKKGSQPELLVKLNALVTAFNTAATLPSRKTATIKEALTKLLLGTMRLQYDAPTFHFDASEISSTPDAEVRTYTKRKILYAVSISDITLSAHSIETQTWNKSKSRNRYANSPLDWINAEAPSIGNHKTTIFKDEHFPVLIEFKKLEGIYADYLPYYDF